MFGRFCGVCYIQDFKLPSYVFKLNNALNASDLYDVIFVSHDETGTCNGYIIDHEDKTCTESVNAYYWPWSS